MTETIQNNIDLSDWKLTDAEVETLEALKTMERWELSSFLDWLDLHFEDWTVLDIEGTLDKLQLNWNNLTIKEWIEDQQLNSHLERPDFNQFMKILFKLNQTSIEQTNHDIFHRYEYPSWWWDLDSDYSNNVEEMEVPEEHIECTIRMWVDVDPVNNSWVQWRIHKKFETAQNELIKRESIPADIKKQLYDVVFNNPEVDKKLMEERWESEESAMANKELLYCRWADSLLLLSHTPATSYDIDYDVIIWMDKNNKQNDRISELLINTPEFDNWKYANPDRADMFRNSSPELNATDEEIEIATYEAFNSDRNIHTDLDKAWEDPDFLELIKIYLLQRRQ